MKAALEEIRRIVWPRKIELRPGETLTLGRCVGRGHHKDVYTIRGRPQVLKLLKKSSENTAGQDDIVLEVESEARLRELDIGVATIRDHDPEGRWIIVDYVSDRPIEELIRTGSPAMASDDLVAATAHVVERLRGVGCMLDMGPSNWVLGRSEASARLIALEAAIKPHCGDPLWFERTYLPLWTMHLADVYLMAGSHRNCFRIERGELEKLHAAWAHESDFVAWRRHFGGAMPDLGRPWEVL